MISGVSVIGSGHCANGVEGELSPELSMTRPLDDAICLPYGRAFPFDSSAAAVFRSAPSAEVAAVLIVGGTGAFGRDHSCAERTLRGAFLAERRTIGGLARAAQNEPTDAGFGFARCDRFDLENFLGVVVAIFVAQPVTGLRNRADSAPLAIGDFEHL